MFLYRWIWNQQPAEVKEKRALDAASLQQELKSVLDAKDVKTRAERSYNDSELIEVDHRMRAKIDEWKKYDLGVFVTCHKFLKSIDEAPTSYDKLAHMESVLFFLSDKTDFLTINRYFAKQLRSRFASVYGFSLFGDVIRMYGQIANDKTLSGELISFEMDQVAQEDAQLMLELAKEEEKKDGQLALNQDALRVQAAYTEQQKETQLVAKIQELLRESEISPRQKRLEITKSMFTLLTENRWFMDKYPKFRRVVKDKFYEIIVNFGMTEFIPYYQPLFDEPFPYPQPDTLTQ